jgi:hypothetical protein
MANISHTKIKQPSFGEKRPKLTYTKICRFTVIEKYGRAFLPPRCVDKSIKARQPYKVIAMISIHIHDEMSKNKGDNV